jgi:hypothetical protein
VAAKQSAATIKQSSEIKGSSGPMGPGSEQIRPSFRAVQRRSTDSPGLHPA